MNRQDIIYWIDELKKMEQNHPPELDHKDCGEIAELLYCLMKEVEHLKTMGGNVLPPNNNISVKTVDNW